MKSITYKLLLASGLFLLPALSAQASVDSTLRLDIKCYYQLKTYVSGVKSIGTAKVVRLDSKQLIVLLGKQVGIKYSGGSQLQVAVNGQVFITNSAGDRLGNVSKYLKADLDTQSRVYDGFHNNQTNQETTRNYFPVSFTMDLPGVKGTVYGMANELFKITPPTGDGLQLTIGHTDADVNGSGSFSGALAHYNGKLALDGRKAIISK
ncbi:MAG: hypothetical protein ABIT37_00485 [Luteolibacter sp.]